jgi:uncharacterized protein YceK
MRRTLIAFAILVTSLTGCSTIRNLFPSEVHETPPWEVYGGTRLACDNLHGTPKGSGSGMLLVYPLESVDIASSAVADTFTLPFTAAVAVCRFLEHAYHYYFPPVTETIVLPPGAVLEGVPIGPPDEPVKPAKPGL